MSATVQSRARVLLAALLGALVTMAPPARAASGPPDVAPARADGADVVIEPAVVRAPDGRAELDVVLGADAPTDVVVEPRLATAAVADDGTVRAGDEDAVGTVSRGARLAPGERLRVVVSDLAAPVLVIAEARAADQSPGTATTVAATALVLPGDVGGAASVTLVRNDVATRAVVTAATPLLVTVAVAGREHTTYPDRLVLPERPLELTIVPARWPLPTEIAVTDEAGRTVRASTGTAPLVVAAGAVVGLTALLLAAGRRRVRRG